MDSGTGRNPWCWPAGSAGSHLVDIGGNEEVLQSPTTPRYSLPVNSDWQTLGEESWPELEQLPWFYSDLEDDRPEQLSWFNSDLEDHPSDVEFRSQLRVEPNGNSHGSSESCKNFSVAGDRVVAIAPGPENLGMCSRATEDPLPKRNHTAVAKIAQNLILLRNPKTVDGVNRTGKRHRRPNWTLQENRSFLQHMELQKGKSPWKAISDGLKTMGFAREAKACENHWGVLLADLTKFEKHFGSDNILRDLHFWPTVGTMNREQRSQNGLPLVFEVEWFETMARIEKERSKHRKSRREHPKGRMIHVAGTPNESSSRRQQSISAASATPSSEIFNNPVGDGDGISGLVKLLGSTEGNVTVKQRIELARISLEAQKMDLRRQEIEWERERMYQGRRNGLTEKAQRRSPTAHEWN